MRYSLITGFVLLILALPTSALSQKVTIAPNEPTVGNCFPFGDGNMQEWPPVMGFIYKNVPAFQLNTGDILAFDMGAMNSTDVQLKIELARTTVNGGIDPALPYTTVVTNTQTPLNPNGDNIIGNFEMQFTAEAPFSFPGGGLIIRFSEPSVSYQQAVLCEEVLVRATSADTSGFFVLRFFSDPDGLPPYMFGGTEESIGGFRVMEPLVPVANVPAFSHLGILITVISMCFAGIYFYRKKLVKKIF